MILDDLYKEIVLQYSAHPLNKKVLNGKNCYKSHQENQLCGDVIDLSIIFDNKTTKDAAWEGAGCAICTSSASIMTELVKNKNFAELNEIFDNFNNMMNSKNFNKDVLQDAISFEGVKKFPMRIKCALLVYMGLKQIINTIGK